MFIHIFILIYIYLHRPCKNRPELAMPRSDSTRPHIRVDAYLTCVWVMCACACACVCVCVRMYVCAYVCVFM